MSLREELQLKRPIAVIEHEGLLNVYYTAAQLKKCADDFFRPFGLTDVQFNALMLLHHQGDNEGLSQARLSDMMLSNRANITSLIDRMERAKLVRRTADTKDRRYNIVKLTAKGKKLLAKLEPAYAKEVKEIMGPLNKAEHKKLISMLGKIRKQIKD